MSFEQRKASTLASLSSSATDKSPKGTLDSPIIPLLDVINSHPDFFTTSSCSGRISVFSHPANRRKGGSWLFITHHPTTPSALLPLLFPTNPPPPTTITTTTPHHLVFRFEPLIIAVECRHVEAAERLVALAVASGLRESGVTSIKRRVIVGIRSSMRLEVPLGETNSVLVSEEYVRFLVGVANEKMEANRKRTDGFLQALLATDGFASSAVGEFIGENGECGNVDDDDDAGDLEKVDGHVSF